jgi:3-oxoacyl-[acyl-carrier protein] reductase
MSDNPSKELSKKPRALVLGGNGDIGSAISNQLQLDGYQVSRVGRGDFNLGSKEEIADYFSKNGNNFDVLVHSSGINHPKLFEDLSDDEIRESLNVNLHGFLQIVEICLPYWQKNKFGRVVVISSLYGFLARKGRLPYVISKHALNGAVKTLAIELASQGIMVNAISPGYIGTKMTYANNSTESIQKLVSGIPVGKLGEPQDIAEVASLLCSPRNKYLTGQDIVVDGGFSVGGFQ